MVKNISPKVWLTFDFVVLIVFVCWGNTDTLGFAAFATLTSPLWVSMVVLTIRSLLKSRKEEGLEQENKRSFLIWAMYIIGILIFCYVAAQLLWSGFRFM